MCQTINCVEVSGVTQSNGDAAAMFENRDRLVTLGYVTRDGRDNLIVEALFGQIYHFVSEMRGLGCGQVLGADDLALQ